LSAGDLELIGGHRAIDFVNTLAGSVAEPAEQLHRYADLLAWSEHAAALSATGATRLRALAEQSPARAAAVLAEVLALRAHADAVLRAQLAGRTPPAESLAGIHQAHMRGLAQATLSPAGQRFEWTWADPDDLAGPLWPLANDIVELLRSDQVSRLQLCVACRWLFLDLSRNHSRRWCRMNGCGARAKMRRYRASHR
jgi:predicted RNA-binding Zn ribbon-like protein